MPFIRLTVARPRPDRLDEVRGHYEELVTHASTLPGFLAGWVVESHVGGQEVGRLTMWDSRDAADRAANDPHAMSLHSELEFDVTGDLWDRSFEAYVPGAGKG